MAVTEVFWCPKCDEGYQAAEPGCPKCGDDSVSEKAPEGNVGLACGALVVVSCLSVFVGVALGFIIWGC